MHNVHEDEPVVFQTRWVLSYLAGPMTRHQIKTLMDPRKQTGPGESPAVPAAAAPATADTILLRSGVHQSRVRR